MSKTIIEKERFEHIEKVTDRKSKKYTHFHSYSLSKSRMKQGNKTVWLYYLTTGKLNKDTGSLDFNCMNIGKQGLKDFAKWILENIE